MIKSMLGAPALAAPAPQQVHIWKVNLHQPLAASRARLSPDEETRAARFKHPSHQNDYITTRTALRRLLSDYTHLPPTHITFSYAPLGKPRCDQLHPLDFNISHSDGIALIAITMDQSVGIDIERMKTGLPLCELATRILNPTDLKHFLNLPIDEQTPAFFNHWVQTEARLKCLGVGFCRQGNLPLTGSIHHFSPAPNFAAAVAVQKHASDFVIRDYPIEPISEF